MVIQGRKQEHNRVYRWFSRNRCYFMVGGVLVIGFAIGISVGLIINRNAEPMLPAEQTIITPAPTAIPTVVPTTTPTVEPVTYYDVPLSRALQDHIRTLCDKYDVPMPLVLATIDVESSFRPTVVSNSDDYGYMQINVINHDYLETTLGITDVLDPYQNISGGIFLLSQHYHNNDGDIVKAAMCYNNGVTGALRLWDSGQYSTAYTDKIVAAYEKYIKMPLSY